MNIDRLLVRLRDEASVVVAEEIKLPDGTTVYILQTHVSFFPHTPKHLWYVLVRKPGQDRVEEEEVEVILRRFWHGEIDITSWLEEVPKTVN
jgi:hypothetical protein